jgi:hypothetical protein
MKNRIVFISLSLMTVISLILTMGCAQPAATSSTKITPASQTNRWLEMLRLIPEIKQPIADNLDIKGAVYIQDYAYLAEKQARYPAVAEILESTRLM